MIFMKFSSGARNVSEELFKIAIWQKSLHCHNAVLFFENKCPRSLHILQTDEHYGYPRIDSTKRFLFGTLRN